MKKLLLLFGLLFLLLPTLAQEVSSPETIELEASDAHILVGDFYRPVEAEGERPAILLMHQFNANRSTFEPLVPYLLEAGFYVINVDLRGFGETGGSRNFELAQADVQSWLDWLREQEGVDDSRIAIIGASIGSNLALVGCAADEACVTAVALSPGEDYYRVMPGDAIAGGLNALVIASHDDRESRVAVENFLTNGTGEIMARLYTGSAHGTALFTQHLDGLASVIVAWLEEQFAAV